LASIFLSLGGGPHGLNTCPFVDEMVITPKNSKLKVKDLILKWLLPKE
jgi:hypothetical protein